MRALVIADDDSAEIDLGGQPIDLLISLGDIFDGALRRIIDQTQPDHIIAVRGNHDSAAPFPDGVEDLHLRPLEISGTEFGGFKGCWRYKPRGHHLFEQADVCAALTDFPAVDVFIAHNSPRGIHERDPDVHQGFDAFNDYITRAQPRLFLHGHQHLKATTNIGATTVIGIFGAAILEI